MKVLGFLFLALTVINGTIFFFRDSFAYYPSKSYTELYDASESKMIWTKPPKDYLSTEVNKANKITTNWFNEGDKNVYDSALKIAKELKSKFKHHTIAKPSNNLDGVTALNKYLLLSKDTSEKLWCGTYSEIFNLFCSANNIKTRYIEIVNPGDHHVVNEVYSTEYDTWALVDVTSDFLLPVNKNGQKMNLAEFAKKLRSGNTVAIYPYSSTDTISNNNDIVRNYYLPKREFLYYSTINLDEVYEFDDKAIRYVYPVSWYDVYQDREVSNINFYLKISLLLLWLCTGAAFLIAYIKK